MLQESGNLAGAVGAVMEEYGANQYVAYSEAIQQSGPPSTPNAQYVNYSMVRPPHLPLERLLNSLVRMRTSDFGKKNFEF